MTTTDTARSVAVCHTDDLIAHSGVAAKLDGAQIAIFYLPNEPEQVFALDNYDPLGQAHVISRGIVGDRAGALVVASPLYKQHFDLRTGQCQEEPDVCLKTFATRLEDNQVWICL